MQRAAAEISSLCLSVHCTVALGDAIAFSIRCHFIACAERATAKKKKVRFASFTKRVVVPDFADDIDRMSAGSQCCLCFQIQLSLLPRSSDEFSAGSQCYWRERRLIAHWKRHRMGECVEAHVDQWVR